MVLIVHLPDVASASSNIMDITLSEAPIYVVKQTCFNACSGFRAGVFLWLGIILQGQQQTVATHGGRFFRFVLAIEGISKPGVIKRIRSLF